MQTVRLEEARAGLGDLIDRARLAGEPTLITRYGKPAAVVVSEDWYRLARGMPRVGPGAARDQQWPIRRPG